MSQTGWNLHAPHDSEHRCNALVYLHIASLDSEVIQKPPLALLSFTSLAILNCDVQISVLVLSFVGTSIFDVHMRYQAPVVSCSIR